MNKQNTILLLSLLLSFELSALMVDFESFGLEPDTFNPGPVPGGDVTETENPFGPDSGLLISTEGLWEAQGGLLLTNTFNEAQNPPGTLSYTFWNGIGLSTVVDTTTPGLGNEGASYPGGGASLEGDTVPGGSYGIFYDGNSGSEGIVLPEGLSFQGLYVTNTTYAALSMLEGDSFARKFEQGDWFQLLIVGLDENDDTSGEIPFFLADYRDINEADHTIINEWEWIDLREFDETTIALQFLFYSSDTGDFGINTPTYVAIDNILVTPTALAKSLPLGSPGWSHSPWFGEYYDQEWPWIYQEDLGWLFLEPISTPEDMIFYWEQLGWAFTSEEAYPWVYSLENDVWLYYIKDTVSPWLFYNQVTGEVIDLGTQPEIEP